MKKIFYSILITLAALTFAGLAQAAFNPAARYCDQLGYSYMVKDTTSGQVAYCVFPDSTSCDDWAFFTGKCGQKYNYCTLKGYGSKAANGEKCATSYATDCTLCVVNGQETPLVEVMDKNGETLQVDERDYSFKKQEKPKTVCGDGSCDVGEDTNNCAQDCKATAPITPKPKQDFTGFIILGIIMVILILSGVAYLVYKKFLGT